MANQPRQAMLTLDAGPEADVEDLEGLTRHLRTELLELDEVAGVDLVRAGERPEKAKADDPIMWGMLLLTFVSGGGLAALIGLLQPWLARYGQSSVTVKIGDDELTVTGNPTAQQRGAVEGQGSSEAKVGNVTGGIHGSVIVGRDFVLQIVQQAGLPLPQARNLPAQLAALQQALPHLDPAQKAATQAAIQKLTQAIAGLPKQEQAYRERVKQRFQRQSGTYVEITAEAREQKQTAAADDFDLAELAVLMERIDDLAELAELRQRGQEVVRVRLDSLREALARYPCIVLLGEPGCGKTTALENLAYQVADRPLNDGALVLPVRLSEYRIGLSPADFLAQNWRLSEAAGYWQAPELAANLEGYLEAGRLIILFDALNEMPGEDFDPRVAALHEFMDHWGQKGNRFLVTCRVLDYSRTLSGLQRVEVLPFSDGQIQAFLQKVLKQHGGAMWAALSQGSDEARRLLAMARNPYMLKLMVQVYVTAQGGLPPNRAELLSQFSDLLFRGLQRKRPPGAWLHADIQREALSVLAYQMQARPDTGTVVETYELAAEWPETLKPKTKTIPAPPLERVLELAASANIIEMPPDRSSVRFYHQLLQEYFAARHMLKADPATLSELWRWPWWLEEAVPLWVRPERNYDPLPPPPQTGWEETTILAAGLAPENDDQLVRALIEVNPVLAGRCVHEGQAKVDPAIRQKVIEALLETIARPEVALRVRIEAGNVLGYLGDPRLGEMVTVPAGKFVMGDEFYGPQHEVFLPDYQLGKYPLTNAEFRQFIEAGGYQEKGWWTEAGWAEKENPRFEYQQPWTEPRSWDDSRFNKPNQPVIGVSWPECVAYCCWLSAETGQVYRLPTEAEWEKGARGVDGRWYPWGDEFEASRLNAREGEQIVWTTTPVGIYPAGVSPFGAYDCAGNVLEWCATKWEKWYPYDVEEDEWNADYLEGTDDRVLRGGSWNHPTAQRPLRPPLQEQAHLQGLQRGVSCCGLPQSLRFWLLPFWISEKSKVKLRLENQPQEKSPLPKPRRRRVAAKLTINVRNQQADQAKGASA